MKCSQCQPVLFHHEDGWDVYPASECYRPEPQAALVPRWFDGHIVEDARTKAAAVKEWKAWHVLGVCLFV